MLEKFFARLTHGGHTMSLMVNPLDKNTPRSSGTRYASTEETEGRMFVSVLICTRNRADSLRQTLESLFTSDNLESPDWEVVCRRETLTITPASLPRVSAKVSRAFSVSDGDKTR